MITFECRTCKAQVDANFYPGDEGWCSGPPDYCSPPEPEDIEFLDYDGNCAEACPECARPFDGQDADAVRHAWEEDCRAADEARAEDMRDEGY